MQRKSAHEHFDFLKIVGIGRKRKSRQDSRYATLNRRLMAGTIDSFLLILLAPVFDFLTPVHMDILQNYKGDEDKPGQFLAHILNNHEFVVSWLNNFTAQISFMCVFSALCWHFWSATPGKMIMRIKIVDANTDGKITDMQIFLRVCGYFISALFLFMGFFWVAIDKKRRSWHDLLAGTSVVVIPWEKTVPPPEPEQPLTSVQDTL